ncbi:MAG TPA: PAS domain-containing sensor histidine kinase, partial [Halieaceae bacterium]|nr:PAS domain-containing sensor histidine kinase [Halieaceae bacterium]
VQARLQAAGATLSVTPVDRTLALRGDRDALAGALANLVVNAIEAGGAAVHVDVWAGALNRERMLLRVRDNGPGVAQELRERIFDPFFTTRSTGTGLGLAVVARTVNELGGEIRLGDSPQGGAEFILEFPVAEGEG